MKKTTQYSATQILVVSLFTHIDFILLLPYCIVLYYYSILEISFNFF